MDVQKRSLTKSSNSKYQESEKEDDSSFTSLVVMEFNESTPDELVDWLITRIELSRCDGGANCQVQQVKHRASNDKGRLVHIGSKRSLLLMMADIMELRKEYYDGSIREFSYADRKHYKRIHDNPSEILTTAEKQKIIVHQLRSMRYEQCDLKCTEQLYDGECIVPHLLNNDSITNLFPLHDRPELKLLTNEWLLSFNITQPLDRICSYFGSNIAIYFAFLEFYTMMLIFPSLISVVFYFFPASHQNQVIMSALILIWSTVLFECWKRYSATLEYKWGTLNALAFEDARSEYYGTMSTNPVTGRVEPYYSKTYRMIRLYFVSVPVVLICLVSAFFIMLVYFDYEFLAMSYHKENQSYLSKLLTFTPSIVYTVIVIMMNKGYRWLAKILNDWENHRKQSSYDEHLILKLVLFDSVNCFISLFYVAFYLKDLKLLRDSLATLLIVSQIIDQITEAIIPYYLSRRSKKEIVESNSRKSSLEDKIPQEIILQAEIDIKKCTYESALEDYLEMYLQYGYVCLFSAVFPSASVWAFVNNVTELRSDASKLLYTNRRPFANDSTNNIRAWQVAFEGLNIISVMTNCALIGLNIHQSGQINFSLEVKWFFVFVLVEHGLLLIKLMISYLIPDQPMWIRMATEKNAYESKRAWIEKRLKMSCEKYEKKEN